MLSIKSVANTFCLSVLVLAAACPVSVQAERLSAPTQRVGYNGSFGNSVPKWNHDVAITWRNETTYADSTENLTICDREGKVVRRYRVWFPDAALVKIWDASASADRTVAVVGLAVDKSGRYIGFLCTITLETSKAKVIDLSPFEGRSIVYAPDNTLWILGWELGGDRRLDTAPSHHVLRHYTGDGLRAGEYFPWPGINCGEHPRGGRPKLTASKDRIGVFLPACSTWLEVALTGDLLGRWQWQLPDGFIDSDVHFATATMTPDNRVYCHFSQPERPPVRALNSVLRLNRERSAWEVVDSTDAVSGVGKLVWLAGVDHGQLVYLVGSDELIWMSRLQK